MASDVSICNHALSLLGANSITSLNDDSNQAKLCKNIYEQTRDAVLEEHNWTFATKWLQLAKDTGTNLGGHANSFTLPPDVLRVIFVGVDHNNADDWQMEDGKIVSSVDICTCQVIYSVSDPNQYSPQFIQALSQRLAADLAVAITASVKIAEAMMQMYQLKLRKAAMRDSQQGTSRRIRSSWLNRSRSQGVRVSGPTV